MHSANRTPVFALAREQTVRRSLDEVFDFFSDARNLEALTPRWLRFRVLKSSTDSMREGTTIDYRLRVRGFPIRWRSLISTWQPPFEFVDEQLIGPYRSWVHRHTFEESADGVVVSDHVEYSVPGGEWVHRLFVRRDLERIFDCRRESLASLLPDEIAQA